MPFLKRFLTFFPKNKILKNIFGGESRGLVVKGEDSQLSGCGFESRRRILDDVSQASYYIGKREIKVAKWGTPKFL